MTPREFEELVAAQLRADGYETRLGSYVGDWGVDIVASKGDERLAVQAKMYGGSSRRVNREAVMQLYGAAAYFECTGALLATDGAVAPDAQEVAAKLGVRILPIGPTVGSPPASGWARPTPGASGPPTFDVIWERFIIPLAGRTLTRDDGSSNTVQKVDWAGLTRTTSGGNRQFIPVEIFRYAIETVLARGSITRDDINQHYPGRASSGIVLVLAQVPPFEVTGRPVVVRMRPTP